MNEIIDVHGREILDSMEIRRSRSGCATVSPQVHWPGLCPLGSLCYPARTRTVETAGGEEGLQGQGRGEACRGREHRALAQVVVAL